jgi:hypothetical protein
MAAVFARPGAHVTLRKANGTAGTSAGDVLIMKPQQPAEGPYDFVARSPRSTSSRNSGAPTQTAQQR